MNNQFGLDAAYFKKNLEQLARDADNYTPAEMCRALDRLSNVARHTRSIPVAVCNPPKGKE